MSLVVLDSAVASRRANGGARRVGIVGLAVLAAIALGADPVANAAPVPGPSPSTQSARRAFLTDISTAGFGDSSGSQVALDQGPGYLRPDGRWPQSTQHGQAVLGGEPGAGSRQVGAGRRNRYPRPLPVARLNTESWPSRPSSAVTCDV